MGTHTETDDQLERPHEITTPDAKRQDGRPTGADDAEIRPGADHSSQPTEAPEERGATPATEHAPGGDL